MGFFHGTYIPKESTLAGTSALCEQLKLNIPIFEFHAVSKNIIKNNIQRNGKWTLYSHSYWPGDDIFSHLVFSLKYETINLGLLKKIFEAISAADLETKIKDSPTGTYSRKIWFLYEWLTHKKLSLSDLKAVTYAPLLDDDVYFTLSGEKSSRHKVINNLIGISGFCFTLLKTEKLRMLVSENLSDTIKNIVQTTDKRLISRAASFLLLADTKATYEIEGERAPQNRLERWAKVILEAGKYPLNIEELERLHSILLKDSRFTKIGLRNTEVFLGDRDQDNFPRPEFIGAKLSDVPELMNHWLELNEKLKNSNLDPILQAVVIAFTFVYIHPLQDGNGRLHRYLLHHILADRGFTPKGIVFPVSAVIFDQIEKYKQSLTAVTSPLLEYIEWESDDKLNVQILNDTEILYQYLNLTGNAEFFYEVVKETINKSLPEELNQLKKYDRAKTLLSNYIEMPEKDVSLLINTIRDNQFKLSNNKKTKFFNQLSENEIADIENLIKEAYESRL